MCLFKRMMKEMNEKSAEQREEVLKMTLLEICLE